ncbi:MAG: hypothetical protein LC749_02485 [Actinobacteria bacterium]|nr:hypothetical protein [Actinomycetota bacterium]
MAVFARRGQVKAHSKQRRGADPPAPAVGDLLPQTYPRTRRDAAYGAVARHLITYADNPRPKPQTTSAERTRRRTTPIIRRFDRISVDPLTGWTTRAEVGNGRGLGRVGDGPVTGRPDQPVTAAVAKAECWAQEPAGDVPAQDLVPQRVELSPGIGLGRPVERYVEAAAAWLFGGEIDTGQVDALLAASRHQASRAVPGARRLVRAAHRPTCRLWRAEGERDTSRRARSGVDLDEPVRF